LGTLVPFQCSGLALVLGTTDYRLGALIAQLDFVVPEGCGPGASGEAAVGADLVAEAPDAVLK